MQPPPMSALLVLREVSTTLVAVAVACRGTSSARATDMHYFPRCDAFSSQLFDMLPVKINTFITNRDIAWPCDESVDLVLTFPAEGTHRERAPLWLVVHPHRSSAFLSYLIAHLLGDHCLEGLGRGLFTHAHPPSTVPLWADSTMVLWWMCWRRPKCAASSCRYCSASRREGNLPRSQGGKNRRRRVCAWRCWCAANGT